ncbi:MAG: response regulator [Anaerolineaceae bacterium]|nr:response regulator [Anaerolineaceae bacterium]
MMTESARILIVDDNEMNRDMLARRLERDGHEVLMAESGLQALAYLEQGPVDLMLLDIMMPKMSGYEVLEQVKANTNLPYIPVIIISAVSDLNSVVRCIEIGAEDYLFKPFNPILLKARVDASLTRKRLSDWQQQHLTQLEQQSASNGIAVDALSGARILENASVLLLEVMDIDQIAGQMNPVELVDVLNEFFAQVQGLAQQNNLTVARSMAGYFRLCSGATHPEHAIATVETALALQAATRRFRLGGVPMSLRIGIGSGAVTMGTIDAGQYQDVWGEAAIQAQHAVNVATRGSIILTAKTAHELAAGRYYFQPITDDGAFYEMR